MQEPSSANLTPRAFQAEVLTRAGIKSLRLGKTSNHEDPSDLLPPPTSLLAAAAPPESRTPGWLLAMAPACAGYLTHLDSRWLAEPESLPDSAHSVECVQEMLALQLPVLTGSSQMQLRLMQQIEKLERLQTELQQDDAFCQLHPAVLEAVDSQLQLLMELLQRSRQLQHLERRLNEEYVQISQLLAEIHQAEAPSPERLRLWCDKLRYQLLCRQDFEDRCAELEICGYPVSQLHALLKDYKGVIRQVIAALPADQLLGRAS